MTVVLTVMINIQHPYKQRDSADHRLGGENPFYGAHMMQMLLDQQAKTYSKETEMLRKEMEQLKVSYEICMI